MVRQTSDIRDKFPDAANEPHSAGELFKTWSYESVKPFSLEALREMVRKDLPASVYRCKGIVFVAESPEKRYTLQIVGRRTEISEIGGWDSGTPRTQLVAIGASGDMNSEKLTNLFESCLSE